MCVYVWMHIYLQMKGSKMKKVETAKNTTCSNGTHSIYSLVGREERWAMEKARK